MIRGQSLMNTNFKSEVQSGNRFEFGKNWSRFLSVLNDERIAIAEQSLKDILGVELLEGKTFLDIGSGSGLLSLCARRLGAQVTSFDYDPQSVACTKELKNRYFPDDPDWNILGQGSVLEKAFIESLGAFDVVYSWGVLHHTGDMWTALEHAAIPVKRGGVLYISIYNDQGSRSKIWKKVKQLYCSGPVGRAFILTIYIPWFIGVGLKEDLPRLKNPFARYGEYKKNRGMSMYYDWIDWLGGYPFEVARPEEIFDFFRERGFELLRLHTVRNSLACHEEVFRRKERAE